MKPISGLKANRNYYENVLERLKHWKRFEWSRLREKIDPKDWIKIQSVAEVNALYNRNDNAIIFPAGILQGVFFNSKLPKYMNYGSVGGVIGHEITHGVDDGGRRRNYKGEY